MARHHTIHVFTAEAEIACLTVSVRRYRVWGTYRKEWRITMLDLSHLSLDKTIAVIIKPSLTNAKAWNITRPNQIGRASCRERVYATV